MDTVASSLESVTGSQIGISFTLSSLKVFSDNAASFSGMSRLESADNQRDNRSAKYNYWCLQLSCWFGLSSWFHTIQQYFNTLFIWICYIRLSWKIGCCLYLQIVLLYYLDIVGTILKGRLRVLFRFCHTEPFKYGEALHILLTAKCVTRDWYNSFEMNDAHDLPIWRLLRSQQ